jgi:hypothetical protein
VSAELEREGPARQPAAAPAAFESKGRYWQNGKTTDLRTFVLERGGDDRPGPRPLL